MSELILGPILRYVGETEATVWVETDGPAEVEILGRRAATWSVHDHHYALVLLEDLEPGTLHPYDVKLDGEVCWEGSALRTMRPGERVTIAFGSCRVAVPHHPPYTESKDENDEGREVCALYALEHRLRDTPREDWPDLLLLLGDQVYADEDAPHTRVFIRGRRDTSQAPGDGPQDFTEYAKLYHESWGEPNLRRLLSNVSTAMIFDDHDVHDDWNTSESWLAEMEATDWWHDRIRAALESYWVYQHLGNLSPRELRESDTFARIADSRGDQADVLRREAEQWDHKRNGARFSHSRTLGHTKLVVFDSREGRTLDEGDRRMFDEAEWKWICDEVKDPGYEHLILADTLPVLMSPVFHYIEAWNERVAAGAWGDWARWPLGEKLRRDYDLEHWAAFYAGFERLVNLIRELARGEHRPPPRTITLLGGDVHHAYLAEVALPRADRAQSVVSQLVCSPFRNPLERKERTVARLGGNRAFLPVVRLIARSAGVPDPDIRWRLVQSPTFDNQVATLELDGPSVRARIERTTPGEHDPPRLEVSLERQLA